MDNIMRWRDFSCSNKSSVHYNPLRWLDLTKFPPVSGKKKILNLRHNYYHQRILEMHFYINQHVNGSVITRALSQSELYDLWLWHCDGQV
ncbi:hypothetical protein H5410_012524 [Solanum commersonii]|uniref:Uncharacterized protein n=1 Tax=Solanum commersonii TaxID=4109 RepID=A0A9J6ASW6_SOLCO|nr:hypothetical protein H5410_012524 [Solanum commersonii]